MKRRHASPFSLSFLDIMSCGLGAAVLLFLIIKHQTDQTQIISEDLSAETNLLEEEIRVGEENLARIKNTISDIDDQLAVAQGRARQIQEEIDELKGILASLDPSSANEIEAMQERIALLEKQKQTLEQQNSGGNRVRQFVGQGERQYLTGIKLGGERVLVLVDSSASMLDETIVNIIRRRNRSDEVKLASEKWRQTLGIVDWIVANLDPGSNFQLYSFNEIAKATVESLEGSWINSSDKENMELALENLYQTVPEKGTSLLNAFEVIKNLSPQPDNVFLITDGLPTMAETPVEKATVSSNERVSFFNTAMKALPRNIPINTLLLPMEGDYYAAAAFWRLALETQGSFVAPPRDWP